MGVPRSEACRLHSAKWQLISLPASIKRSRMYEERHGTYSVKPPYVMGSIFDSFFPASTSMSGLSPSEILVKVVIFKVRLVIAQTVWYFQPSARYFSFYYATKFKRIIILKGIRIIVVSPLPPCPSPTTKAPTAGRVLPENERRHVAYAVCFVIGALLHSSHIAPLILRTASCILCFSSPSSQYKLRCHTCHLRT